MADAISWTERLQRALKWEKAVVTLSFCFCVIMFLVPGVLLGRFVAPAVFGTRPAELSVLVHLAVGGFVGLACIGTIIIALELLYRITFHALRSKIGRS